MVEQFLNAEQILPHGRSRVDILEPEIDALQPFVEQPIQPPPIARCKQIHHQSRERCFDQTCFYSGPLGFESLRHQTLFDIDPPYPKLIATNLTRQTGDHRVERRSFVPQANNSKVLGLDIHPAPPLSIQLDLGEARFAVEPTVLNSELLLGGTRERCRQQFILGSEMVNEAIDADAQRCCHWPQRHLGKPVVRQIVDHLIQQFETLLWIRGSGHTGTLLCGGTDVTDHRSVHTTSPATNVIATNGTPGRYTKWV